MRSQVDMNYVSITRRHLLLTQKYMTLNINFARYLFFDFVFEIFGFSTSISSEQNEDNIPYVFIQLISIPTN